MSICFCFRPCLRTVVDFVTECTTVISDENFANLFKRLTLVLKYRTAIKTLDENIKVSALVEKSDIGTHTQTANTRPSVNY